MRRSAIPRRKAGYTSADLDGEFMLYSRGEGKALYLNETASLVWKLCDGRRTVDEIDSLLKDAYPDASELSGDLDAAFGILVAQGAVEIL